MLYKVHFTVKKLLGKTTIFYKGESLLTFWFTAGKIAGDGTDLIILKHLFNCQTINDVEQFFLLKTKKSIYTIETKFNVYGIKHLEKLYAIKKTGL